MNEKHTFPKLLLPKQKQNISIPCNCKNSTSHRKLDSVQDFIRFCNTSWEWCGDSAHHDHKERSKPKNWPKHAEMFAPSYPLPGFPSCPLCPLNLQMELEMLGEPPQHFHKFLEGFHDLTRSTILTYFGLFCFFDFLLAKTIQKSPPSLSTITTDGCSRSSNSMSLGCLGPRISENFPSTASFFKGFMKPPLSKKLRKSASLDLWSSVRISTSKHGKTCKRMCIQYRHFKVSRVAACTTWQVHRT